MSKERILVLGASSWLGYLLIQQLSETDVILAGTVFRSEVTFPPTVEIFRTDNAVDSNEEIMQSFKPTVIVNFLRGEDEQGFQLHQKIIEIAKSNDSHYVYASSVLALDGYTNTDLVETLEAKSISPYGIFKANCEKELYNSVISWCLLRFSSVQGWVPHKSTRNQVLLEKLANNTEIKVDRGVLQNRILASLLVEGIVDLMSDRVTGIIHFGATDASEEYDFLRKQAEAFGFNSALVHLVDTNRNVNLVAIPGKIYDLYGDKYKVTEKETLEGILEIVELKNFKSNNSNGCIN